MLVLSPHETVTNRRNYALVRDNRGMTSYAIAVYTTTVPPFTDPKFDGTYTVMKDRHNLPCGAIFALRAQTIRLLIRLCCWVEMDLDIHLRSVGDDHAGVLAHMEGTWVTPSTVRPLKPPY